MNSPQPTPEPVRTPLRRYWREFRIQWLPVIAFALMAVCVAGLWQEVIVPHTIVSTPADPAADDVISDPEADGSDNPAVCTQDPNRPSLSCTTNLGVRTPRAQD